MKRAKLLDLRVFLPGKWHLTRVVKGFSRQDVILMKGTAVFIQQGTDLTYKEEGDYAYHKQRFCFHQTYYYQWKNESGYAVCFQDKRPFYFLAWHDRQQKIRHLCGKDTYQGLFTWRNKNSWGLHWHVEGPTKDFRIETVYCRYGDL